MKSKNEGMIGCERCIYCHQLPAMSTFTSTITNEVLIQLQCETHEGLMVAGSTLEEAVENWKIFLGFIVFVKVIETAKVA
jgi:hypothetical protein